MAAMEPIVLHSCLKHHMCDRRGKAVSAYDALSVSLLILKQCVREALEAYMTKPPHQVQVVRRAR